MNTKSAGTLSCWQMNANAEIMRKNQMRVEGNSGKNTISYRLWLEDDISSEKFIYQ